MKKIKFNLSVDSLSRLQEQIKQVEMEVENAKEESVKEVVDKALNTIMEATPIDTGATVSSTHAEYSDGKVEIIQEGDHVFENEFGDGIYGREQPYPESLPPAYSSFTHSRDYYFYPTDPSSKYWRDGKKKSPLRVHSSGNVANAQMYKGSLVIKENLAKIVKQKVRDKLSKI